MNTQPINCPHCSRSFVDWGFLEEHIQRCREEAQRKLDQQHFGADADTTRALLGEKA